MTFSDYQYEYKQYDSTAGLDWHYTLGLVGEAGEVAEKIKKKYRLPEYRTEVDKHDIAKELGDVLWYLTALGEFYGVTLEDIAALNLDKLRSRKQRGVLGGTGDNR